MTPNLPARAKAQAAADAFNAQYGVTLLRVDASVNPVFHLGDLATIERLGRWATTRSLFEHVYRRAAEHGELINLGRQLSNLYPRRKIGSVAYYFAAPEGTPVPETL